MINTSNDINGERIENFQKEPCIIMMNNRIVLKPTQVISRVY